MTDRVKKSESISELRKERDRFVAFAFASADLLMELDPEGVVIYTDGAISGLLGIRAEDIIGKALTELVSDDDRNDIENFLKNAGHFERMADNKIRLKSRIHGHLPFIMHGYQLPYLDNHYYLTFGVMREDIAPDEFAKRDMKSGLLKKENFAEVAAHEMMEAIADGKDLKMTLLDLPELTRFLDGLSADQATQLMMEISDYLRSHSFDGDTAGLVSDHAYSFVHDGSISDTQIESELASITKQFDPSGNGLKMSSHTIEANAEEELTEQDCANAILYTISSFAEQKGEDFHIQSLAESYDKMLEETLEKVSEFKKTVNEDQFKLAFQPIVDLKTGVIHHYEVLVRFNEGTSFENPFQFISFGEQAGLIGDFDLAMTERAIGALKKAAKKGYRPTVAVNISGKSMSSKLFKDTLYKIVQNNEKFQKQIIFEITESAKISDMKVANEFLQEMRKRGILCCLDDFGVGESSFDYLRSLHVDYVKIDGSYVREALKTRRGQQLLRAMSALCKDLGITTIGEMVEDNKTASKLWQSGVHFGQGYLFGKPEVDEDTLANCNKPSEFYHGASAMRAKRVKKGGGSWWSLKD